MRSSSSRSSRLRRPARPSASGHPEQSLDHIHPQAFGSLDAPVAADPVADGQYHIQIVEVYQSLCLADAIGLNYPEFPDCCLLALLMVAVDVDDMLADGWHRHLRKCYLVYPVFPLREPHLTSVLSKRYAPKRSMETQQIAEAPRSTKGENAPVPINPYLRPSTP